MSNSALSYACRKGGGPEINLRMFLGQLNKTSPPQMFQEKASGRVPL